VQENVRLAVAGQKSAAERRDWTLHNLELVKMTQARDKMMTNGPRATIGGVLPVGLDRPRDRLAAAQNMSYVQARAAVIEFLYARRAA